MKTNKNKPTNKAQSDVDLGVIPPFKRYKYFNMDEIDNLIIKLKWWQKIILWFKPAYIGMDIGRGDKAYYTIVKKLGDKTIVLKTGEAKITIRVDKAV